MSAPASTEKAPERAQAPAGAAPRVGELHVGFLAGVRLIAGREIAAYFDSLIAYVYTIVFVLLANLIFMNDFFLSGTVDMSGFFRLDHLAAVPLMPLLLAFFLPAITMRLWAEEKKQRTIELLLTLPITPMQAILGKYAAALGLFSLFLLGSLPIVIMLVSLGSPDLGEIVSSYIGLALFGALFLSFGMLLSALSGDQIVAFVTSTLLGFFFVLTGYDQVVAVLDGISPGLGLGTLLYESVSVMPHYDAFVRGLIDFRSLLYFVLMSGMFLYANALVLERNRE